MEDSSQGAHGVGVGWDGVGRLCPQLSRQGRDMSLSSLTWVRGAFVREAKKHFGFLLRVLECSWGAQKLGCHGEI